jgi:crossover junction endodeoxyribonuclease RuvC
VLGIDPGTAVCGFGVVRTGADRRATLVECGVVRTRAGEALPDRLMTLAGALDDLLERHRPDALALENVFLGRNARTALVLGHARGVVMVTAARRGVIVAEITPREVKRAVTGTGAATKPQVAAMVARLLRLASAPEPADAADGVAIALTHLLRMSPRTNMAGAGR